MRLQRIALAVRSRAERFSLGTDSLGNAIFIYQRVEATSIEPRAVRFDSSTRLWGPSEVISRDGAIAPMALRRDRPEPPLPTAGQGQWSLNPGVHEGAVSFHVRISPEAERQVRELEVGGLRTGRLSERRLLTHSARKETRRISHWARRYLQTKRGVYGEHMAAIVREADGRSSRRPEVGRRTRANAAASQRLRGVCGPRCDAADR